MVVVYAARPLTARRWTRRHEAARDAGFACACLTWTCASCRGSGPLGHNANKRTAALKRPNKRPMVLELPMHDYSETRICAVQSSLVWIGVGFLVLGLGPL